MNTWSIRTAYRENLATSMGAQHLVFRPHAWLEMLAERNDTLYLYSLCCEVERHILGTLLGINRIYPPSPDTKWMVRVAGELPIVPCDLANRLGMVFRSEPREGVRELGCLVEETIELVEKYLPKVETTSVRDRVA